MAKRSRCACGKVRSKYASECETCYQRRKAERLAANNAIWDTGVCPDCGAGLHINLAIHGWIQCDQFGAVGFRKDNSKPQCEFQMFIA